MRYLFGGILSLLFIACQSNPIGVCENNSELTETIVVKTATALERDSRDATVEVHSLRQNGTGLGTGTVYKYKGQIIVLTAAHVLGSVDNMAMISTGFEKVVAKVVYFDKEADLAVLVIPEITSVEPMKFRPIKKDSLRVGQDLVYSGYPNVSTLLTIRGYVSGFYSKDYIAIHSYGWSGASGSSIFTTNGRLVGVLMAIDVGEGLFGMPNIIEDIVVVVPIWRLDIDLLNANLGI